TRASVPAGRENKVAVKRDSPGFRVPSFTFHFLLMVCLSAFPAIRPSAAQSASGDDKPKDGAKREDVKEVKKDDVRKDTAGTAFKPGGTIHFDVDLALV